MSVAGWFRERSAERRATALVEARLEGRPIETGELGEVDGALIDALSRLLRGADERKARAVIEVLALTRAPESVEVLVGAIEGADVWLRGAISRALQQLDAPAWALTPLTTAPSPAVRAAALPALARLSDGANTVSRALVDPAPEVRLAALALVEETATVEALLSDAEPLVRAHAARRLHDLALVSAAPLGEAAIDTALVLLAEAPPVREAAARLLGLTPDPRVHDALVSAAARGNLEALRALGRTGGPQARDALVAALRQPGCVGVAAEALAELGDASVIPAIEAALAELPQEAEQPGAPTDRGVARSALDALRRGTVREQGI